MSDKIIPNATLDRIERDISWVKLRKGDGSKNIAAFSRDHGNLLVQTKNGEIDILYLHDGDTKKSDAARVLQHASPDLLSELVTGYRMAKKAGLLEQKRTNRLLDDLKNHPDAPVTPDQH